MSLPAAAAGTAKPAGAKPDASAKPGGLIADFHGIRMNLAHWHYDTFLAGFEERSLADQKMFLQFLTNLKGDPDRLQLSLEPSVKEIVFTRRPPARLSDPAFLKTLVGDYALVDTPAVVASVTLRGESTLVVSIPRQPEYTLVPHQGTEFQLKGLTGFSLRFVLDDNASGRVNEVLFIQPDGIYRARSAAAHATFGK